MVDVVLVLLPLRAPSFRLPSEQVRRPLLLPPLPPAMPAPSSQSLLLLQALCQQPLSPLRLAPSSLCLQ